MIKKVLIVGGSNGIGLAIATAFAQRNEVEKVYIVDKVGVDPKYDNKKFKWFCYALGQNDFSFFDQFTDVDCVMMTAGFGHLSLFEDIDEELIQEYFDVNTIPTMKLVKRFYNKLKSTDDFYFGVMVSIAGFLSSPYYSVYGATKAALRSFIESVNVELKKSESSNRILNVSPGHIEGTAFGGGKTDLEKILPLANEIINNLEKKNDLFIPQYKEIYKEVLDRYAQDFRGEGERSYEYKKNKIR